MNSIVAQTPLTLILVGRSRLTDLPSASEDYEIVHIPVKATESQQKKVNTEAGGIKVSVLRILR